MDYRIILDIAAITGVIIYGIFAVIGYFDKNRKDREAEADKADERVIFLLKEQVAALEKKVSEQAELIRQNSLRLEGLMAENKTLREVLQGRDKTTTNYQAQGLATMKKIEHIADQIGVIHDIVVSK